MKKLICNEAARCQRAGLQRKLFRTSSFMYFAFILSECITITSSEEALKMSKHNFFYRKVVLLVIYLLNHDSSKSTIFIWILKTFSWVQFLSNKLDSFVSRNIKFLALCFDMYFFIKSFYEIHTFSNNLNEEGMITSHLMCANFFIIKIL